ncbi:MAG: PAS domain S-box protein, partial [Bacteroidota bacterium]
SDKAILDEHNKVVAIVGVGRNITERKLAEEALYESNMELLAVNSQLETAQRIGLIGSWSYDPATRKLRGSAEAKRLFGQPLDDEHFTLARVEDCIPDRKRVHQALVDLVGKGIPYEIEYSINPADGSPQRIVLSRATLDADPEGKPLSVNGIIQDISARRQAEEAIRQSSNKWETLVSTTPDGIGMVSLDGKLLFMSDNLAEIYGYTSEEKNSCLGANVFDFIDPSCHQEMVDNIGNLAAGKSAYNLSEYLAVKKDSSRIQVELYSTLLSDAAGNPDKILYIERDITGRKEAENAIQRSEAMYRSILHASPDAVVITGLDGQILIISPITLSLLGYNDESQVVGLKLLEFLVPEDHEKALSEIGLMQQGLLNGPEEYQAIRADGTFLDIEVNGEIARKAEGRPDTMIFIIRDITGRKRAEAELFESKELLNSIVETALDSIFIKDLSLRYIKANSAMETLFGIPVGQILGKTDTDLFGIENAAHIEEIDRGVLAGVNFEEFPSKPVNGELRHFHTIKVPLKDVRGNVTGLCGIARDITERKVAEDNLRLSENRFLRAAEQTQTVIWEVDADGLYTYVSRHAKNVWGYDPGELTGKKHFYDLHPEEGREQFIKSAMDVFGRRATFQNFPNSIVTSNGDTIHVETNGTPLLDDQNNLLGYLGSDIDITERKKAEIEILDKTNLLTNLIINLQEGILLEDSNRKIILTNQLFCDMFGIPAPPEAMSGADCSDSAEQSKHYFTNPDTFIRDIVRILENKKTVLSDELELADGRCFERDYIPTFVEQEYSGHLWKYRDITERKRAERELGESQVKYRNLVENISDVIYEIGIDGIIKYISPPIEKILGYSPEEITGRNFIDFVGITAESLSSRLKMLPESKVLESEYKLVTKSGQPCWIRLSTTALFADGVYIGGSGTLIDITERKVAEEKLIRSEEGFRKLSRAVQQSPAMTCITGLQGIIEYVNPKVQEVTGYTEDELVGQNARILSSGEKSKEEYDLMWQIIRAGNEWKGEFHNKKKNGELYWVTAAITPILDGGGQITHYLAIEEDITARKIADKALQE